MGGVSTSPPTPDSAEGSDSRRSLVRTQYHIRGTQGVHASWTDGRVTAAPFVRLAVFVDLGKLCDGLGLGGEHSRTDSAIPADALIGKPSPAWRPLQLAAP
jgi:hypothetical protein